MLVVAWLVWAAARAEFVDVGDVRRYLFSPLILKGLRNTIIVSVCAQLLGVALGLVFAIGRMSRVAPARAVSAFYIWFFRGTPVLVQLFFWFNGVPSVFRSFFGTPMVDVMTPFMAALLGLGLNEGAYMAEIVRAGISSVDRGQTEAASALGMTSAKTLRRVVLPQAMRVIIPPTGNEFISMLKTSSLATVVTYGEMMRRAQDIYSTNFKVLPLLIVVSLWYLAITSVASVGQHFLERRYSRGEHVVYV